MNVFRPENGESFTEKEFYDMLKELDFLLTQDLSDDKRKKLESFRSILVVTAGQFFDPEYNKEEEEEEE